MSTARTLARKMGCLVIGVLITLPGLSAQQAGPTSDLSSRLQVQGFQQPASSLAPAADQQTPADPRAVAISQWLKTQIERNRSSSHQSAVTGSSSARQNAVSSSNPARRLPLSQTPNRGHGHRKSFVTNGPRAATRSQSNLTAVAVQNPYRIRARSNGSVRQVLSNDAVLEPAARLGASRAEQDLKTVRTFVSRERVMLGLRDPDTELRFQRRTTDKLGHSHLRFSQRYQGLPVFGAEIITQLDSSGNMISVNGSYSRTPPKNFVATPAVSSAQADLTARSAIPAGQDAVAKGAPELLVYLDGDRPTLAWHVRLQQGLPILWSVFIDARTGAIVTKFNEIPTENVAGSGIDLTGTSRALNVWHDGAGYVMMDASKPMYAGGEALDPNTRGVIRVVDANNQPSGNNPQPQDVSLFLVTSASPDGAWLPDAVSAARNFSLTYDYFQSVHSRNSYDGMGGSMLATVRFGQNYPNAFYVGGGAMYFGTAQPYAAGLDVVAHELSHGVIDTSAHLIYQNQSGALNEHFADVFGEMAEARSAAGTHDWLMGTNTGSIARSFIDPNSLGYPERMSQFVNSAQDNGGVHVNSSIMNHAYYLVATGSPNAAGIGIDDADQIWYRALTTKLGPSSQFLDARIALIQSADELFGANSAQSQAVAAAFNAVELYDGASNPAPGPVTGPTGGEDANLFVFFDGFIGDYFLGRLEPALGDQPPLGSVISASPVGPYRVTVTGDGELAVYVNSVHNVCVIPTDRSEVESCFGSNGDVWSVTASPDGSLVAFVFIDSNDPQHGSNQISVIDIATLNPQTYTLAAPAPDTASGSALIEYADAMDIQSTNEFLIYDALNRVTLADGQILEIWSIYALDLSSGSTLTVVPPIQGLQIGYPSIANTNDYRLVFDVLEEDSGLFSVVAVDFNTKAISQVASNLQDWATPAYSGNDGALLYSVVDQNLSGFSIWRQPMASDGVTVAGATSRYIQDAGLVAPYRRGSLVAGRRIDLSLSGQVSASQMTVGQESSFNYSVVNSGKDTATGITVTSTVPASVQMGTTSGTAGSTCNQAGGQSICTFADLPSGQSASMTVRVTPQAVGSLHIGISTNAEQTDEDPSNNTLFLEATAAASDSTPNAFTFNDVVGVAAEALQTSNVVTVSGISTAAPISVVGGQYSIGCGSTFTSSASTISNGQTVCVRHTSGLDASATTSTTLTIGGVSDTFTSTTAAAVGGGGGGGALDGFSLLALSLFGWLRRRATV